MGLWEILKGEQPGIINTILHYENKGQFGEYSTEFALTNRNLSGNFFVYKNIYIPYMGKTTEIDLLMLHERGIFVFESKNYSGWIFGSADQQYWTQMLQNREKHQFYNPIKQNRSHIKALAEYLNLPQKIFSSYIVFSERCSLKKVPLPTENIVVLRRPEMLRYLRNDLNDRKICYSSERLNQLSAMIQVCTDLTETEKQQHVQNIRERLHGTTCPFCGQQLVLRHGHYGDFWGCSTYPNCKFTRKKD